jgi:tetratricopeptide (TPR) repeat protein
VTFRVYAGLAALLLAAASLIGADDAFDKAERALSAKDYDTAIASFEEALTGDPDSLRDGSEYRQATIRRSFAVHAGDPHIKEGAPADYDREIAFFEKLAAANPKSANAVLNYGFSYVDKIPAAGTISQVILANNALGMFTKSIELKPSWIALYTRGNSYLYWPKIFGKYPLGVADLERAYAIQKAESKKSFHVRVYISLGDAYWLTDNVDKARIIWKEGIAQFPDSQPLKERLARGDDTMKDYLDSVLDPNKRVDTDLRQLWMNQ